MGVILLGKIKIHEIAKKINLASKEVVLRANELNIEVKSHLSSVTEEQAKMIEDSFKNDNKKVPSDEKIDKKENKVKKEKEQPVIIRREVIVSEEEIAKKEKEEKNRKQRERKESVGFIERNKNKDYNIVYRNKPSKPLTVEELFGLNKQKEEKNMDNESINKESKLESIKDE